MRLPGREYAHFAWTGVPETAPPPQAQITGGAWFPAEWWDGTGPTWDEVLRRLGVRQADVDAGQVRVCRVLLAGPTVPPGDAAAVLPGGRVTGRVRLDTGVELIVRDWTEPIEADQ